MNHVPMDSVTRNDYFLIIDGKNSIRRIPPSGSALIPVVKQLEKWADEFRPAMKGM